MLGISPALRISCTYIKIPFVFVFFLQCVPYTRMSNLIYSTLFKTQKENQIEEKIEERNHKNMHTSKTTRTCGPKY